MVQLDVEARPDATPGFEHYVEVAFARNKADAEVIRLLLASSSVPAQIESDTAGSMQRGIAVLVPADKLVEASEILTVRAEDDEDFVEEEEDGDEDEDYDDDFDDDEEFDDDDEEEEEFEDDDEI